MAIRPSRRMLVRAVAGMLALAGGRRATAATLLSQQAAQYQASPNDTQMCGTCTLFIRPDDCKLVEGPVVRQGWCRLYDPVD